MRGTSSEESRNNRIHNNGNHLISLGSRDRAASRLDDDATGIELASDKNTDVDDVLRNGALRTTGKS